MKGQEYLVRHHPRSGYLWSALQRVIHRHASLETQTRTLRPNRLADTKSDLYNKEMD